MTTIQSTTAVAASHGRYPRSSAGRAGLWPTCDSLLPGGGRRVAHRTRGPLPGQRSRGHRGGAVAQRPTSDPAREREPSQREMPVRNARIPPPCGTELAVRSHPWIVRPDRWANHCVGRCGYQPASSEPRSRVRCSRRTALREPALPETRRRTRNRLGADTKSDSATAQGRDVSGWRRDPH